ncbi:plasmid mobilization protein [Desulfotalea psychrophila]|uniref:Related to TraJ protein n=1 Tax=Desulfotalea psychrophila (strain LSv54 / DSM 12343) TaxID=177439 RepID=Q6AIC5_DESPS|nr:conjugal transfer protein TraJ [Desulfotalea psychrophila]CAG37922.1 related to TraJ protein [Desulfotalea psychrophila LSv54]
MVGKKVVRNRTLKAHVTLQEYELIIKKVYYTGLTQSEFIRRALLGKKIESMEGRPSFLDLLKVNGDLGRLGGLFKFYLSGNSPTNFDPIELRRVLKEIESTQKKINPYYK